MSIAALIPAFLSRTALLAGMAAALLAAGCRREAPAPAAQAPGVLAVVEGRPVTEADFRLAWGQRPATADTPQARQALLDQLIERSALAAAARRAGVDQDPELAAEIDRLLISRLRTTRLQGQLSQVEIPEAELRAQYEQQRATRFSDPERVRAAVLWFDTRGQAPLVERYRPRLEAARAQVLQAGPALPATNGFGALALTNSEHRVSRFRGGDVGWLSASPTPDAWHAEALRLASALRQPGDLSEVTATPAGLFLVRLIARQPGGEKPFAAVRDQIRRSLIAEQRRRVEEQFKKDILGGARIERTPDAANRLAALPLPTPAGNDAAPTPPGPPALPQP
jgi:parvulin-like peptidyl-prolyl isomerase